MSWNSQFTLRARDRDILRSDPTLDGYLDIEDVRRYIRVPKAHWQMIAQWMESPHNPLPHVRRPGKKGKRPCYLTKKEWVDNWLDQENAPHSEVRTLAVPFRAIRRASPDLWRDLVALSARARELGITWDSIPFANPEHAAETRLRTLAALRWSLMERAEELEDDPEEQSKVKMLAEHADTLYRRNVGERGAR